MTESIDCALLCQDNADLLKQVADGVLDNPVRDEYVSAFLSGNQNIFFIAVHQHTVVGMVSGVIHNHPDKPKELWINEVGVGNAYRKRGIAKRLLNTIIDHARKCGCVGAWVLTRKDNRAANALYASVPSLEGPRDELMYWAEFQH